MSRTHLDVQDQLTYTQSNRRSRRLVGNHRAGGTFFSQVILPSIIGVMLILSGCRPRYSPTPGSPSHTLTPTLKKTPTASPTLTPHQSLTPSRTAAPSVKPSMMRPSCLDEPGTVIRFELEDPSLIRNLSVRVYLPPCYSEHNEASYPTLYLLHGLQSNDDQWDAIGIDEAADELIREQEITPFIIVMPWHRTGIDLEETLVNILIPYIDQVYDTDPSRLSRAIGGVSRGGGWALQIGLRYPELFSAVGLHSPATFYNNLYIYYWVDRIPDGLTPRIWIDIGEEDPLYETVNDLMDFLQELGVSYSHSISNGGHTIDYWTSRARTYLRWYALGW